MLYKIYQYEITFHGKPLHPDKHYDAFQKSAGPDAYGDYAEYRGQKNAVLMHLQKFGSDFTGLIGKHSTERKITSYNPSEDETARVLVGDNDYPNCAFVCMPRLGIFACVDSGQIKANSAIERLHLILNFRSKAFFIAESIKQTFDLRKAVSNFRLIEVKFEILPVNPHTGDLGRELDESRKRDHIKKIVGSAHGSPHNPLLLEGGFLTAIQELQESGHCRVGFTGVTEDGRAIIQVPKQSKARALSDDSSETVVGENVDVRVDFKGMRFEYPFTQGHVTQVRTIARMFMESNQAT